MLKKKERIPQPLRRLDCYTIKRYELCEEDASTRSAPTQRLAHNEEDTSALNSEAISLGVLLHLELGSGVGHLDVELLGALNDLLSGLGGDAVGDLSAVLSVVHQEQLQLLGVVHEELVEAVGQQVAGGLVRA